MKKILLSLSLFSFAFVSNAQVSWTEQVANIPVANTYIGDISIVDANVAWGIVQRTGTTAATNYQTYTKTIDGGTNWTAGAINIGNSTTLGIGNITAVDANTAWVTAFPFTATTPATQGVYKTTNGGSTWTRQSTAAFDSNSFTNFVYFWNANEGVCMGDKKGGYFEIYTTTNGGTNWVRTPSANIAPTTTDWGYTGKYYVAGNTIWFGTDGGQLVRSTNKGLNWTVINTPITDFGGGSDPNSIGEFAFRDDNNGVIQETVNESFYVTTDGGVTWTPTPTTGMYWGSIGYAGTMLVSGGSTTGNFGSSYSTNNGTTWTGIDTDSHTCLAFKDATTGWGGGFEVLFKFNNALSTDEFGTNGFKVYPNPAHQTVNINVPDIDGYQLSVTDLTGKVVMQRSLSGMENTLDVSSLSGGVYFFNLSGERQTQTIKIIKD